MITPNTGALFSALRRILLSLHRFRPPDCDNAGTFRIRRVVAEGMALRNDTSWKNTGRIGRLLNASVENQKGVFISFLKLKAGFISIPDPRFSVAVSSASRRRYSRPLLEIAGRISCLCNE
jgi:hypothetical protein